MQAHNVFCKGCGYHILMPNRKNIENFAKADGVGHALVPEGNCPECGRVYNVNEPDSYLRETKAEEEVVEDTGEESAVETGQELAAETVDSGHDDSQAEDEGEGEPEANSEPETEDSGQVGAEESTEEMGELNGLGDVEDSDEDLTDDTEEVTDKTEPEVGEESLE